MPRRVLQTKLFAALHHARLDGAGSGGRRRRSRWCRLGTRALPLTDADADVCFRPHVGACRPNARIPLDEVTERNSVLVENVLALGVWVDQVEAFALLYHASLRRQGGGDAVGTSHGGWHRPSHGR